MLIDCIIFMNYTEKQYKFAKFLLYRIGFKNESLIDNYLILLRRKYGRTYFKKILKYTKKGKSYYKEELRFSADLCLKKLIIEYKLKRDISFVESNFTNSEIITSNDIANFSFCPVSFAIKKSFKTNVDLYIKDEKLLNANFNDIEKLKFVYFESLIFNRTINNFENFNPQFIELIKKIRKCQIVFSSSKNPYKHFFNTTAKISCQPQYIFQDPNGDYFVIEEKFRFLNESTDLNNKSITKLFFINHLVKIRSYIDFIEEYNIKYGIIIYWYYDFFNLEINIHDVAFKILKNNDYIEDLYITINNVLDLKRNKKIQLGNFMSLNKCINCSVTEFCGHKTQTISILQLPYNKYYMQLKPAIYPD